MSHVRSASSQTVALVALLLASTATAGTIVVHSGESIQAAIDAAPPGWRILVESGTYHEPGAVRALTITKNGITLAAAPGAQGLVVLEQSGTQTQGVWVSPADSLAPADVELPPCGANGERLTGFRLSGFTVEGFAGFGVYLACVDRFNIRNNIARRNLTYAIFPVRSAHGRMSHNDASGTHDDACLYVGQDETILVDHNHASDCLIGLQIENSRHVRMQDNMSVGNTTGMIVDVVNGRQATIAANNAITRNVLQDNNRPNTAAPALDTSRLPPGIGLVVNGADRTLVAHNTIAGNTLAGMTLESFCLGEPTLCMGRLDIDPTPDKNRFVQNAFQNNGTDVIYLPGGGQGNCFRKNNPSVLHVLGGPLPVCH
jgi:nitrous oxidase accessory protein NosD